MREFEQYLERKRRTTPNLDTSELDAVDPLIREHFNGRRVRIEWKHEDADGESYVRTGRVSVTTGWRPAFILMHRSSDTGSGDVLGPRDRVTHVQYGRTYVPVSNLHVRKA